MSSSDTPMSDVSSRSGSPTISVLGKRTRTESETAEAAFSKKRMSSVNSEIKLSLLFAIPREIRDMIVGNLLRAGDLGILRVSKALSEEGLERISQEATCRIHCGCFDHVNSNFSRPAPPARIRKVEFYFHLSSGLIMNPPTMTQFREDCASFRLDELNTARESTCNLTLTYGTFGQGPPPPDMHTLFFQALRPLAGFEKVVLNIVSGSLARGSFDWRSGPEVQTLNERRLKPTLEHFLGAVTVVGEVEGRRMVFHPRGRVASPSRVNT